jgi:hypothetical protein
MPLILGPGFQHQDPKLKILAIKNPHRGSLFQQYFSRARTKLARIFSGLKK